MILPIISTAAALAATAVASPDSQNKTSAIQHCTARGNFIVFFF